MDRKSFIGVIVGILTAPFVKKAKGDDWIKHPGNLYYRADGELVKLPIEEPTGEGWYSPSDKYKVDWDRFDVDLSINASGGHNSPNKILIDGEYKRINFNKQ